MKNTLPIVTVATACEHTLQEQDGVLSLIRVVDQFTISTHIQGTTIPEKLQNMEVAVALNVVICLKSGDYKGEGELSLKLALPDGTTRDFPEKWPFLMEGGEKGVNVRLSFGLSSKHVGLTWMEIYWNSEYLSKFPITLLRGEDTVEKQHETTS